MSEFLASRYASLDVYTPGEQPQDRKYIKLNTNESPYPPSQAVLDAVSRNEVADLRLYSDPACRVLTEKLAARYQVKPENVYLSNGSDDILNFSFMAYASDGGKVAYPDISYGFYPVYAKLHNADSLVIPLEEDFSVDYRRYCHLDRMVVLANPNAPTGRCLPVSEIEEIVKSNPKNVVLIDEAYIDFGGESCLPLIHTYPNLLVVRTFSKSRSLAGARLGFALGNKALIDDLNRLKFSTNPYNVNRLTLLAGAAAIDSDEYFFANSKRIVETRAKTTIGLEALGFEVLPSCANFIFAKHPRLNGEELYRELKARGVLVRHFASPRICDYNRITIGSENEMETFLSIVREILTEKGV